MTARGRATIGPLQRLWADEDGWLPALLAAATAPLAVLYGTGVRARNLAYDRGALRSRPGPIPVVSVGNLAVGGTGKTPVSAWIVRSLAERGHRPALVSRGYGEDELLLHERWNPNVPVIRSPDRTAGVLEAAESGRTVAVLDDGFQHRALRRDLDIVLLSPAHPFPPRVLPRGPFREPLGALRRADRILITAKGDAEAERAARLVRVLAGVPGLAPAEVLRLGSADWTDLEGVPAPAPSGPVLAVCSIASPAGFIRQTEARVDGPVHPRIFRDHHDYSRADAQSLAEDAEGLGPDAWIATTEKDVVKLIAHRELLPTVRVLPLVVAAEPGTSDRLLSRFVSRGGHAGSSGERA